MSTQNSHKRSPSRCETESQKPCSKARARIRKRAGLGRILCIRDVAERLFFVYKRDLTEVILTHDRSGSEQHISQRKHQADRIYQKTSLPGQNIIVGDYSYYDDVDGAERFEEHVTHHYEFLGDRLIIGKFCAIARGVEFRHERRESQDEQPHDLSVQHNGRRMGAVHPGAGGSSAEGRYRRRKRCGSGRM